MFFFLFIILNISITTIIIKENNNNSKHSINGIEVVVKNVDKLGTYITKNCKIIELTITIGIKKLPLNLVLKNDCSSLLQFRT